MKTPPARQSAGRDARLYGRRDARGYAKQIAYRMGEGESFSVGRRIRTLWELPETGLAVPSPVGREKVRVRMVLSEVRLRSGTCCWTNPMPSRCSRTGDNEENRESDSNKASRCEGFRSSLEGDSAWNVVTVGRPKPRCGTSGNPPETENLRVSLAVRRCENGRLAI